MRKNIIMQERKHLEQESPEKHQFTCQSKIRYILLYCRQQRNLSQSEMANLIKVSLRNYQRIEACEITPKLETIIRIARYLKISIDSLILPIKLESFCLKKFDNRNDQMKYVKSYFTPIIDYNSQKFPYDQREVNKLTLINSKFEQIYHAFTSGQVVTNCKHLQHIANISSNDNIDNYILSPVRVEQLELIYRSRLNQAILVSCYAFPTGIKILEQFYYHVNPNPNHPTWSCLLRDVTKTRTTNEWIREFLNLRY